MMLDQLTFPQLLWLVPILFAIHNIEEAPRMEKWSEKIPPGIHPTVTTPQFVLAVTLLTIAAFIATWFGANEPKNSFGIYAIVGIQAIMFVNAFLPHLLATVWYRLYAPGTVTAVLFNIPFSIYLFRKALEENYIALEGLFLLLIIAPVAMALLAAMSLKIGHMIANQTLQRGER